MKVFAASILSFIVLDAIWLGFIAKPFYLKEMANTARIVDGSVQPVFWAAGLVYLFLALGISYFVIPRVPVDAGWTVALFNGAVFGLVAYGIYDFTCLAVMKDYGVKLAFFDLAWGVSICALSATAAHFARAKFG